MHYWPISNAKGLWVTWEQNFSFSIIYSCKYIYSFYHGTSAQNKSNLPCCINSAKCFRARSLKWATLLISRLFNLTLSSLRNFLLWSFSNNMMFLPYINVKHTIPLTLMSCIQLWYKLSCFCAAWNWNSKYCLIQTMWQFVWGYNIICLRFAKNILLICTVLICNYIVMGQ